jgi:endonuclease/exonuclease/phosphatase family metal-dependent hydrolase
MAFRKAGMNRLRIATYNVHKCRGLDWRVRPARILKVIEEIDADVLALQEVVAKDASYLSEHLRIPQVFGSARQLGEHDYGNAVFSRYPILQSHNYDLSVSRREPRCCLRVDIQLSGSRFVHLFAIHLGTSFFERRHQALKLASAEILGQAGLIGPRVLTGDFNEWTRGLVTTTLSQHMRSADLRHHLRRSRTYPGVIPFLHLDHIYYDEPLQLVEMHLHRTPAALIASDHLPLIGEFKWT